MSIFDYAGSKTGRGGVRVFDRSRRRFAEAPNDESALEERAVPSPRTNTAIRAYFDSRMGGDTQGAWNAVRDTALSWRADNNAGGVPVFGHLPLPKAFAADIARELGENDVGSGSVLRELLVQLDPGLAKQVRSQLEGALAFNPQQASEGEGRLRLLGGDDGDGPQPRQGPSPNSPPMPRQKPEMPPEEQARRANCERFKQHYVLQRRAINEAEGRKATAERRVWELKRQRQYWLNEVVEIEADLRSAQSRSTDPDEQDIVECPSDKDPRKAPRGRRERRAEQQRMIQEGLCTTVSRIDVELAKDRWRERLEHAKAKDISDLQAEWRSAKQKIQEIDQQIAQAQQDAEKAAADVRFYQGGLRGIFEDYEASCGDRRELYPIVP